VDGQPAENVRRGIQITRQTGVVLTPSAGPQDKEIVYLSDSGGHSNLWVSNLANGESRQITFERDPAVKLGVPVWSPDGKYIVFVSTRGNRGWDVGLWIVQPDGSGLRVLLQDGAGFAVWSPDSRWVYSIVGPRGGLANSLIKIPVDGGSPVVVRTGLATRAAPAPDGRTLYYVEELARDRGGADMEIRVASPEGAPGKALARLAASQVPDWGFFHPVISPDGKWLALSRNDDLTNNLWTVSTADGSFHQVTEFRPRRVSIARRVSWSADGRFLFAAVAESESDIVLLTGLKY
jgi:Tol biopolymer transport system component